LSWHQRITSHYGAKENRKYDDENVIFLLTILQLLTFVYTKNN